MRKSESTPAWETAVLKLLMREIYEVCRWDGFKWHDVCTKFHLDRFRHSTNIKVITSTIWEAAMLVLLFGGIYELWRWDSHWWHGTHARFHDDRSRRWNVARAWVIHLQTHRQLDDLITVFLFYYNKESRLKIHFKNKTESCSRIFGFLVFDWPLPLSSFRDMILTDFCVIWPHSSFWYFHV
jgi:hypothetical protein